jgi:uncharacterized protein (DUF1330 family)
MTGSSTAKGYIFAELDVHDEALFHGDYMTAVMAPLQKYGAVFLSATDHPVVLEGGRTVRRIVLIEFASLARADEFYHSPDYQDVIGLRLRSADTHLYLFEGRAPE